ncbi:MAG: NAD(P)-dependent glycerol-3-phosphate dehydrogenase [Hungatella sp.]|nr:NAD(P)-dependent glycerol-3-phosphate dehydrogenase [Hungatella sp.]
MANIGIIGAGTWGTALGLVLYGNGHSVTLWSAFEEDARYLDKKREHKNLPGVKLPGDMVFTASMEQAAEGKDVLVLAVPSIYVRSTARKMAAFCGKGQVIVNVAKGIEEDSLLTLSQVIEEELSGARVAVLSGPSHAEEVSRRVPTTCVAGAADKRLAAMVQNLFMSPEFRVYISPDVLGIELGGALKNVIALAAGIADGLGYGDNTKAALITRGIHEIGRLGMRMGGLSETFGGLSGIGDLIVTCASMHSRNRRAGILIGQGCSMEEAMSQVGMAVEGVYSARAAWKLAEKYQAPMPIVEQVNQVLFFGKDPAGAVKELMCRDRTSETGEGVWEEARDEKI